MILIVVMYALFAAIYPIGRVVLNYSSPFFYTGLRMFISGIILIGYHLIRNKRFTMKGLPLLGFLTLFAGYFNNVPEMCALQYLPSAKASFIYTLTPFMSVLLSYFFFKETLTLKKAASMLVGFLGLMIIFFYDAPAEISMSGLWFISWGELLMLFAVFSSVLGWIFMRKLIREYKYTALEANGISMFLGGILALITSYMYETPWNPIPVTNIPIVSGCLGLGILCSNLLGYNLYGYLLRTYTTTFLTLFNFVEPLFASFYAWVFLNETVNWHFFVGVALVFTSLYFFYLEELRQGYILTTDQTG